MLLRQQAQAGPTAKTLKNRRKRRRQRAIRSGLSGDSNLTPYLLSRVNPFMGACNGVRSPDQFSYPTGTAVLRNAIALNSNALGYAANAFQPFAVNYAYQPSGIAAGGVVAWAAGTNNQTAQYTQLVSIASLYRVVSWGVRITPEPSFSNLSGHIWVAIVPFSMENNVPYYSLPTTEAQVAGLPLSEKWSLTELAHEPLVCTGRAFDDGIYRFRDPLVGSATSGTGAGAAENSVGWCQIIVYGSGLPAATTALNIEVIMHIEYLQDGATLYDFLDARPGMYNPEEMIIADRVQTGSPVAYLESAAETTEKALHFITSAVSAGGRLATLGARAAMQVGSLYQSITGFNRPSNSQAEIGYI